MVLTFPIMLSLPFIAMLLKGVWDFEILYFYVYKILLFPKIITLKIEGSLIYGSKLRREQNGTTLPLQTAFLQSQGLASYSQETLLLLFSH